ncbi:Gene 25-like lysozyme [Filimonas lacunae]|uniref:Gene 25-like lysozyme n=1 Tax=Filimonas lacunae TaxID=477680 RepID=A0A173MCR0_9BACT|nr:GPW/gp25 family protein [Filimonas lacunae]BAV05363.1 hypothetical protein FLA_1370 [Filimonas lacunae]SIT21726.1 Gene 25-like lysozyme [Filimonas lacunae]
MATSGNYKLPFNPSTLFSATGFIESCSQEESIAQNLMLLITTKQGENRFDRFYGNAVWDIDFENAKSEGEWERIFRQSMEECILKYEPRLSNAEVKVRISYLEQSNAKKATVIKKKASIHIQAILSDSREIYQFATEIFLSPLSVD